MDYQLESLTNQIVQKINNLNIEVNNKSTKDNKTKETELKILNELYASIRKYNNFLKENKTK